MDKIRLLAFLLAICLLLPAFASCDRIEGVINDIVNKNDKAEDEFEEQEEDDGPIKGGTTANKGDSTETTELIVNETYERVYANHGYYVSVSGDGEIFRFVPEVSGWYEIYSYNCYAGDPCVYLHDKNGDQLGYDDDDNGGRNFKLEYYLTAGETYYVQVWALNSDGAVFYFVVESDVASTTTEAPTTETTEAATTEAVAETTALPVESVYENIYEYDVKYMRGGESALRFVPEHTGTYRIYSYSSYGAYPDVHLYDRYGNQIAYDNGYVNFNLQYDFVAGETYYIYVCAYYSTSASYYYFTVEPINVTIMTTEAPITERTEAPTTERTQASTTERTEAPTTERTQAPTTERTEAPTTERTQAPTTERTEAPTTERTEAPTTERTQAPTTETTEAPTTETTEPPIEHDFLEFWDKDDLYYDISAPQYYVEQTNDGVVFENSLNNDAPITFFSGRSGDTLTATGKYLFMKYKAPEQNIYVQILAATDKATPAGDRWYKWEVGNGLVNDEEWHVAIIDLSKVITAIQPAGDGQYYLQHFRMDIEGSYFVYLELAYIGITDEISDIADYVKATEDAESLKAVCPHLDAWMEDSVCVDEDNHTILCSFCGYTALEAHTLDAKAIWNATTERYEAVCTVCGGAGERDWQWSRDYADFADGKKFASAGGGRDHSVQNGVLVMTPNGNTTWGGISMGCAAGALGQYYVLKYRVTEVTEPAETAKIILRFNGKSREITLDADGEWHFMIVDLTELGLSATNGLIDATGDHWFCNYADANLLKYEVAFEGCVDSLDRISAEYQYAG